MLAVICACLCSKAIRRKENGWYDEEHPLVFLFLGSSGIGKLLSSLNSYLSLFCYWISVQYYFTVFCCKYYKTIVLPCMTEC